MSTPNGNGYISRGNMTVIISAAGLVMLAFGGFITFQNQATGGRLDELRDRVNNTIPRAEHVEFERRLDDRLHAIDRVLVPSTTLDARFRSLEDQGKLLSDRLNQLRTETGSFVTVRDEIARLHTQIDDMRKQMNAK